MSGRFSLTGQGDEGFPLPVAPSREDAGWGLYTAGGARQAAQAAPGFGSYQLKWDGEYANCHKNETCTGVAGQCRGCNAPGADRLGG